jgi:multidrug efflux system outer membrane protein
MKRPAAIAATLCLLLTGCEVGPDYKRPAVVDLPMDWHWQKARPADDQPKGDWWTIFHDDRLNTLEQQAVAQNADLRAAVARVDAARARARIQGASFFPTLNFDPAVQRQQYSADAPQFAKIPLPAIHNRLEPSNSFDVPLDLNYEVDLWGRVRRSFETANAQAQASVADYQNVLLTLTSDVAVDYLTLRAYDSEIAILEKTLQSRQLSLQINQTRVKAGRATDVDVDQAQTQLSNTESDLASIEDERAKTVDALAVLCGQMASTFLVQPDPLTGPLPQPPIGLPASVLERRPDVAEAERNMAATNAQIGVAYAAFFPVVTLTGQGGFLSASASDLFNWTNSIWSIGPTIRLPIFEGGANEAKLKEARANYNEQASNYRGVVLSAVRDVEDSLADLRFLDRQQRALADSVQSSQKVTDLLEREFKVGQINYTDVTVAQQTELAAERSEAVLRGQQFAATVRLIKALGGGWNGNLAL